VKRQRSLVLAILAAAMVTGAVASAAGTSRQGAEYIDDAAVTARVKTALIQEPGVKADAINAESSRGVVSFLSGFVDSRNVADKAVSAARKVGGVRAVKDDMRAKPAS